MPGFRATVFLSTFLCVCLSFSRCTAQTTLTDVLTYHNNNARTGANVSEIVLTPSNVNSVKFGKLFDYSVDGFVFAQPLYVRNLTVGGKGTHNVVFVATEADSVYAFDANGNSSTPLWHRNLVPAGATPVPCSALGSCFSPVIGITGTPVIDATNGTMYVATRTVESGVYVQRLHALGVHSGADKFGGSIIITATVIGSGAGSSGGMVTF